MNRFHLFPLLFIIFSTYQYGYTAENDNFTISITETKNDNINLESIINSINNKTLSYNLFQAPNHQLYQQTILNNFYKILTEEYVTYEMREAFYDTLIDYLISTKGKNVIFIEQLASVLKDTFTILYNNAWYNNILQRLIENHPTYAEPVFYFLRNLDLTTINTTYSYLTKYAIAHLPSIAAIIKEKLIENFLSCTILKSYNDWHSYITACIKTRPEYAQDFAVKLLEYYEQTPLAMHDEILLLKIFNVLCRANPCNQHLKEILKKQQEKYTSLFNPALLTGLLYARSCKKCATNRAEQLPKTPTTEHLKYHVHKKGHESDLKQFMENNDLASLFQNIVTKEKELQETHYTFIHAQPNRILLVEQLHTFFSYIEHKQSFNNAEFLDLRIEKHNTNKEREKKYHKKLILHGIKNYKQLTKTLFMNKALFGNLSTEQGNLECSTEYILNNKNAMSFFNSSFKKIFKIHGHKELYEKYHTRLLQLKNEFITQISNFGTCILVAIPKKTINKNIVITYPRGKKRTVLIKNTNNTTIETDDVDLILQTLEKYPEKILDNADKLVFCLPMTTYSGLNPQSGIKFFPFTVANPSALDAWYTQVYNLFNEIEAVIKIKNNTNSKK